MLFEEGGCESVGLGEAKLVGNDVGFCVGDVEKEGGG